jgi:hypothetical protein
MSILALLPVVGSLLDKLIPDADARKEAQEALEASAQSGDLDLVLAQLDINKTEAASKSIFVSGWRPFVGWVCGAGLAYNVVIMPLLDTWFEMPVVDPSLLYPVLMGMLGMGGLRTFEKTKGIARS